MKREEVIGIQLECVGTAKFKENEFKIGKIYDVLVDDCRPFILAEDGFYWSMWYENYKDIEDMINTLNKRTNGRFKLYKPHVETKTKKENIKMEKKMKKEDLEGKWFKCVAGYRSIWKEGDLVQCIRGQLSSLNKEDYLFSWFNSLSSSGFTVKELNDSFKMYDRVRLEYIGEHPTQTPKKIKIDEITVKIKADVDMYFSKPIIEESKEDLYIFAGRTTIYFSKAFGEFGIATVNSNELKSYSKEIGMSLAYRRCYLKVDGGK